MKLALCVGINDYQGTNNDLNGCVNDADDWSNLLNSFGFVVVKLVNNQATKARICNSIANLVGKLEDGDVLAVCYSGHGTTVKSTEEQDGYDEALYVYDGILLDNTLRDLFAVANKNAQVVFISDSCFSGGMLNKINPNLYRKPKFVPTISQDAVITKRFLEPKIDSPVHLLLTGCLENEYSYDAYFNDRYNGAMTYYAIQSFRIGQTWNEFYNKLRENLPNKIYDQTPLLLGSFTIKEQKVFNIIETGVDPVEPPPVFPVVPEMKWYEKVWYWIITKVHNIFGF
jgi:hypothetical protein